MEELAFGGGEEGGDLLGRGGWGGLELDEGGVQLGGGHCGCCSKRLCGGEMLDLMFCRGSD